LHGRHPGPIDRLDDLDRARLESANGGRDPGAATRAAPPVDATGLRNFLVIPQALIVASDPDERRLVSLVLRDAVPGARVSEAADAIGFATALDVQEVHVAVVARELGWSDGLDVIGALRRRHPHCVMVLLGETVANMTDPDAQPDAHLSRGTTGLARLGDVLRRALERRRRDARADGTIGTLDEVPIALLRLSPDERVLAANAAAAALLGHDSAAALAGRALAELVRPAEAAPPSPPAAGLAAAAAAQTSGSDVVTQAASGPPLACRLVVRAETREGTLVRFMAALLAQSTAASIDTISLLSGISHDLKQPLSTTRLSAQMLSDRLGAQAHLGGDEERMLRRIVSGTERMETLMDGLLQYVRTGRSALSPTPFELREAVEDVVHGLQETLDGAGAVVRWGELPRIEAGRDEMARLLENLITNAVKFRGDDEPVVDIACEDRGDSWLLSVRDNGIGIAPDQSDRIFEPFQRLHTESEYPGTGIGLATCRQICERHGGAIWVTPNSDQGSANDAAGTLGRVQPGPGRDHAPAARRPGSIPSPRAAPEPPRGRPAAAGGDGLRPDPARPHLPDRHGPALHPQDPLGGPQCADRRPHQLRGRDHGSGDPARGRDLRLVPLIQRPGSRPMPVHPCSRRGLAKSDVLRRPANHLRGRIVRDTRSGPLPPAARGGPGRGSRDGRPRETGSSCSDSRSGI
jgi:signal transduction histidine kinase